jgi:hypothetical protein
MTAPRMGGEVARNGCEYAGWMNKIGWARSRWRIIGRTIAFVSVLLLSTNAHAYVYSANVGELGLNGTNDFRISISLQAGGNMLGEPLLRDTVLTTNGVAILQIKFPREIEKVSKCWLWLGVRPSGSTNAFVPLPPRKVVVQKTELVDWRRDSMRSVLMVAVLGYLVVETRRKFTVPATVRYSTTRLKYEIAAALYSLIWLVPFFILLYSPDMLLFVVGKDQEFSTALPSPLLAMLTTLYVLPRWAVVGKIDEFIQQKLKTLGEIPAQLGWMQTVLTRAEFKLNPTPLALVLKVTAAQLPNALIKYGFSGGPAFTPEWMRAAIVYGKLSELNAENRFSSFFQQEKQAWEELDKRFQECLTSASAGSLDPAQFYKEAHTFVARLVLFCGITEKGRLEILRRMGFTIKATMEGVTFDQMTIVFLSLLSTAVSGLLYFAGTSAESPEAKLLRGLMIAIIYTCSVSAAVYTSRRTSDKPERAWLAYLLASGASVVIAFLLSLAFNVINYSGDIGAALINSGLKYPYLISAGVTCFMTCFMLDTKPVGKLTARKLRILESVAGVAIGAGVAVLVSFWLQAEYDYLKQQKSVLIALMRVPPVQGLCVIFGGLNLFVAALVPHWFRMASTVKTNNAQATDTPVQFEPSAIAQTS